MTDDELDELARSVLATLSDAPAELLAALAAGLRLAEAPVSEFWQPVSYLADNVGRGEEADALTVLSMRSALRRTAAEGTLVSRLADAEQPFWRAVGDATAAVAADLLPAEPAGRVQP